MANRQQEKERRRQERLAAEQAAARASVFSRRVDASQLSASVVDELRDLFERYPGDGEFVLVMHTRSGVRCLRFGDGYKIASRDAGLKAELRDLLGPAPAPAHAAA